MISLLLLPGVSLMDTQSNLTIFEITHIHRINIALLDTVRVLLARNAKTLKAVTIAGCSKSEDDYILSCLLKGLFCSVQFVPQRKAKTHFPAAFFKLC